MSQSQFEMTEPVLPMADIQGIAVPGFLKPHQTLLGVVCQDTPQAIQSFRSLLSKTVGEIATAAQTLEDRRRFRVKRASKSRSPANAALTAVGFTYQGLRKLTPGARSIPSEAFRQG